MNIMKLDVTSVPRTPNWFFLIYSAGISILIFFMGPLSILASSSNVATTPLHIFLSQSALLSLVFAFLSFLVLKILSIFNEKIVQIVMLILTTWIIMTAIFIPLSDSETLGGGYNVGIEKLFVIAFFSTLIVVGSQIAKINSRVFHGFAFFIGLVSLVSFASLSQNSFSKPPVDPGTREEFLSIPESSGVIVVSFDGIPGTIVAEIMEENPEISDLFNDFTLYDNVVSSSPGTAASIIAEQFGNRNYHEVGGTLVEVLEGLSGQKSTFGLVENSWTYGLYSLVVPESSRDRTLTDGDLSGLESYVANSFHLQALSLQKLFGIPAYDSLIVTGRLLGAEVYLGPDWKSTYRANEFDLQSFTEDIKLVPSKKGPWLRQLHFVHSHFPVDYDRSCQFLGYESSWHDKGENWYSSENQNYRSLKDQTICMLEQLGNLVNKLKREGLYDQNTIVIKSDHGEPTPYFSEAPMNQKINSHALWGVSRYQPMLMIKEGHTSPSGPLQKDNRFATLGDLALTLCIDIHGSNYSFCDSVPGEDLLSPPSQSSESLPIYIQIVRDATSTFKFEDHITLEIPRGSRTLNDGLRDNLFVELSD